MVDADRQLIRQLRSQVEQVRRLWDRAPDEIRQMIEVQEQALPALGHDLTELSRAELYWVAPAMVEATRMAAPTLPAWTPATAIPAPVGLMCFGTPLVTDYPWTDTDGQMRRGTVDAAMWRSQYGRPGWIEIELMSRAPGVETDRPLHGIASILLGDPERTRDVDTGAIDVAEASLMLVGAAWLLMGLPRMADTRIQRADTGRVEATGDGPPQVRDVTIIDLRRTEGKPREDDPEHPGREYTHRWWVDGHWRQQACGPERSQRKPVWIAPHVKGPEGLPLTDKPRVHVWRR